MERTMEYLSYNIFSLQFFVVLYPTVVRKTPALRLRWPSEQQVCMNQSFPDCMNTESCFIFTRYFSPSCCENSKQNKIDLVPKWKKPEKITGARFIIKIHSTKFWIVYYILNCETMLATTCGSEIQIKLLQITVL